MSNEVANRRQSTALASAAQMKSAVDAARQEMPVVGGSFIKFAKGDWVLGQEGRRITEDSLWAAGPQTLQRGFVCWSDDNQLLGKALRPIGAEPVDPSDLPNKGAEWRPHYSIQLRCIDGPHAGAEGTYEHGSMGGIQWFEALMAAVSDRIETGEETYIVPVVTLGATSFQSKKWGKQFKPTFDIVDWCDLEGNSPNDEEEPEQPEAPAATRRSAEPAPEPAPEPEEPAPAAGRRRRRVAG